MNMPNYLWGEAVRHATYIINRVGTRSLVNQTPYEAFKKKKPNLEHLRVFGCICYAKIEGPHLRKLDDRSKMLVNLGTEPGSKAYRLLDPTNRKIMVSRDVRFDENRGWNWNNSDSQDRDISGTFTLTFGEFGNNGINESENIETVEEDGEENENSEEEGNEQEENDAEETQPLPTLRRSTRQTGNQATWMIMF